MLNEKVFFHLSSNPRRVSHPRVLFIVACRDLGGVRNKERKKREEEPNKKQLFLKSAHLRVVSNLKRPFQMMT